uniref:Ovule protein n=1 Tax=Brugia timori TaxID=42155 RepID=A0A0R3QEY1_9BILA
LSTLVIPQNPSVSSPYLTSVSDRKFELFLHFSSFLPLNILSQTSKSHGVFSLINTHIEFKFPSRNLNKPYR